MDQPPQLEARFATEVEGCFADWRPTPVTQPRAVVLNHDLAAELNLPEHWLASENALAVLSGNEVLPGSRPIAQAYSGHQFGAFSPVLGDGRAVLLGEVRDSAGSLRDLALKGSGQTPFGRRGDGRAALGPVLREYLMSEAMHALGIPTTRALAALATGEQVRRERPLPGGVLARVADSHLRVGTFEFAARRDLGLLRRLADHAIRRHDPGLTQIEDDAERYLAFLAAVVDRQAALVARWMGIGFIHGVMNTDNMTISGQTIDYGPCAFLDTYDPATWFSSIDEQGRYAYRNQPSIALWNLARLAQALGPLVHDGAASGSRASTGERVVEQLRGVLTGFEDRYRAHWAAVLAAKLGLAVGGERALDLGSRYLEVMGTARADFTIAWRALVPAAQGDEHPLHAAFAGPGGRDGQAEALRRWLTEWREAGGGSDLSAMRRANPVYIPRNHQVERVLEAATSEGDMDPFRRLLAVVTSPCEERESDAEFAAPAPFEFTASYRTFCGT